MKKLLPIFLLLILAVSCKDECQDEFCPSGYVCVDGICEKSDGTCPIGYEGEDCSISSNAKFSGNYSTDYTGTGGLSNSMGNTTATVAAVNGTPNKIRIDVDFDLDANIALVGAVALPVSVSIEGETDGNTYSVPSTTITIFVDLGGFALPAEISIAVLGTKIDDNTLNSTLTFGGLVTGTIVMVGTK